MMRVTDMTDPNQYSSGSLLRGMYLAVMFSLLCK